MEQEIMTLEEVAEALRCDPQQVRVLLEAGQLPGRRIGTAWYVSRRQLMAHIEGPGDARASTPVPVQAAQPAKLPVRHAKAGTWPCPVCSAENSPEYVQCLVCGAVRLSPLVNYRPAWSPANETTLLRGTKVAAAELSSANPAAAAKTRS